MATATKYFTYAPQARNNKPIAPKPGAIVLKAGETLGFKKGKGYYAKSSPYAGTPPGVKPPPSGGPGTKPRPPINDPYAALPTATIDKRAGELAQAGLTPQQEEIRRQQAIAQRNAQADAAAIQGFQGASAEMLAKLGPQGLQGYLDASKEQGQLGQGLATGVRDDVAARVAGEQSFMQSQGQQGGAGPDTAALHDTVYALNGQIPGNTFAEQGAAANQWGLAQAPIALNAGREELDARMYAARQSNDDYAQQLIQLAAQFPGLKAQALQQLNAYEMDKANYRESLVNDSATRKNNAGQLALQQRSERAQEKAAGINAANDQKALSYKWASLEFQTAKARAQAQAEARKGGGIDVAASKLLGHIVYKDGTENPGIKVAKAADTATNKSKANRAKATSHARVTAFKFATTLRGTPTAAPKGSQGKYIAAPGQKWGVKGGVFPPYPGAPIGDSRDGNGNGTTNDPKKAARSGGAASYAEAQQQVWGMIDGQNLMDTYAYSREQVMAIVNDAMRRAGWKRT